MLITTSADNSLGVWDLALERDPEVRIVCYICVDLSVSSNFFKQHGRTCRRGHTPQGISRSLFRDPFCHHPLL